MPTQVILTKDVDTLGIQGETVAVKDGYARNFLLPRGLAITATKGNLKRAEELKRKRAEIAAKEREASQALVSKFAAITCVIPLKIGDDKKAFGSVTAQDIVASLKAQGVEVDRRKVALEHPIKQLGEFEVPIKLHADVVATLKVSVVAQKEKE